jgi:BirA family biotin operon repressor/biotin-[acetyl-CoA-carboxylase] ligase
MRTRLSQDAVRAALLGGSAAAGGAGAGSGGSGSGGSGGSGSGSGGLWTSVEVVETTGSTNADLLTRGGPEGQVLVAEEQTAGRGRMGRSWVSQPGASLTFSVLLRPAGVPPARRGWLPLVTGVAVATAVRAVAGLAATLKWPNDVLIGDRKLAGILAEQSGDAIVVGIGLNVATPAEALPSAPGGLRATSLLVEGVDMFVEGADIAGEPSHTEGATGSSRQALLVEVLRHLERWYLTFRADPDPRRTGLLDEYRTLCGTLGRTVRVELPGGRVLAGVAEDIDADGRLLIRETDAPVSADAPSRVAVSAGDVIHLR